MQLKINFQKQKKSEKDTVLSLKATTKTRINESIMNMKDMKLKS